MKWKPINLGATCSHPKDAWTCDNVSYGANGQPPSVIKEDKNAQHSSQSYSTAEVSATNKCN